MRIREAVRALIIDPKLRVLLVAFDFPDGVVWALPGGGIQEGESAEAMGLEGAEPRSLLDRVAETRPLLPAEERGGTGVGAPVF